MCRYSYMLVSYALAVVQEGPKATAVEVIQDRQQEMLIKLEGRRKLREESYNPKTESVIWDFVILKFVNIQQTFSSVHVFLLGCFLLPSVKCIKSNSILSIFEPKQSSSECWSVCLNQAVAGWSVQLDWEEFTVWWNNQSEIQSVGAKEFQAWGGEPRRWTWVRRQIWTIFTIILSNVFLMFL